jgi:hypothetical protein
MLKLSGTQGQQLTYLSAICFLLQMLSTYLQQQQQQRGRRQSQHTRHGRFSSCENDSVDPSSCEHDSVDPPACAPHLETPHNPLMPFMPALMPPTCMH